MSPKRKLLMDRINLIRSLIKVKNEYFYSNAPAYEFDNMGECIYKIRTDTKSFLSLSQESDNKVSYCNNGDTYNNNTRIKTSIGRYFRRQLGIEPDQISDQSLGQINTQLFGDFCTNTEDFKIVSGEDITEYYEQEFGKDTCMTGENCDKVQLYAYNSEVQLLIFENGIRARALLWTIGDKKVLDRIYPNDGYHVEAIRRYCRDNGYIYRVSTGAPSGGTEKLSDNKTYKITLRHNYVFPYLDTFCHGEINDDQVTLSNDCNFGDCIFNSLDGDYTCENSYICRNCGEHIHEDDIYNYCDEIYCEDCFHENFSYCEDCEEDVPSDQFYGGAYNKYGETYVCENCLNDNYSMCEDCGEYFHNNIINECGDIYLCNKCLEKYTECESCGDFILNENVIITEDTEENICQDCADNNCHYCEECDKYFNQQRDFFLNCKEVKNEDCKDCKEYKKDSTNGSIQENNTNIVDVTIKNEMFTKYTRPYKCRKNNTN